MTVDVGRLTFVPVAHAVDLVGEPVRQQLPVDGLWVSAIDADLADTAAFCEHYGIPPANACNTIIVAIKTTPRSYVACLVTADSRLDVNRKRPNVLYALIEGPVPAPARARTTSAVRQGPSERG